MASVIDQMHHAAELSADIIQNLRATLAETRSALADTKSALADTKSALADTRRALKSTQGQVEMETARCDQLHTDYKTLYYESLADKEALSELRKHCSILELEAKQLRAQKLDALLFAREKLLETSRILAAPPPDPIMDRLERILLSEQWDLRSSEKVELLRIVDAMREGRLDVGGSITPTDVRIDRLTSAANVLFPDCAFIEEGGHISLLARKR